jgi:hypothetical protein
LSPILHRFVWGDFAALSYVWGNQSKSHSILVNGQETLVTVNLEQALRNFHDGGEFGNGLLLWVDALCINQGDLIERSSQVQRMRMIYGSSWSVVAWLGMESNRSSSALQLVRDLAAVGEAGCAAQIENQLRQDPQLLGNGCWLALQELMERPYWHRLWVIQEMIMGETATWIRCGNVLMNWTTFCAGIAVLQEHMWLIKDICLCEDITTAKAYKPMAWSTTSLHLIYQDLFLHDGSSRSFGRLLDMANSSESSDPRDKVYALTALMSPLLQPRLKPDYSLPISHVYTATARAFIETFDNLEPLRDGNPWGPTHSPSWAADWLWEGRVRWSRLEYPLFGPEYLFPREKSTNSHNEPYCADGGVKRDDTFSPNSLLLSCTGVIVDAITGLSARGKGYFAFSKESIVKPASWISIYGDYDATAKALVRTLVADRVHMGERATSSRHSAILRLPSTFGTARPQFATRGWNWLSNQENYYFRWELFRKANRDFPLGDHLLDSFFTDQIPPGATEFEFAEVYACFDRSSQRRRFMTTQNGYIGWAPDNIYATDREQTRSGDLIAVVFGCSKPIIIRPCGVYYQVLGEAYVHGLMDGETIQGLNEGRYQAQKFVFC